VFGRPQGEAHEAPSASRSSSRLPPYSRDRSFRERGLSAIACRPPARPRLARTRAAAFGFFSWARVFLSGAARRCKPAALPAAEAMALALARGTKPVRIGRQRRDVVMQKVLHASPLGSTEHGRSERDCSKVERRRRLRFNLPHPTGAHVDLIFDPFPPGISIQR